MDNKRVIPTFSAFLLFGLAIPAYSQSVEGVKWVTEKENPPLWSAIRTDFHDELLPDDPVKVAPVLAYSYKYIHRVALYGHSALVLVGHLETEDTKYPGYYSAFNYDVESRAREPIKGVEVIPLFKFVRFVKVSAGPGPPDIFFTWFTCTECEASQILSAFHYDLGKNRWLLRKWESEKDIWWTGEAGPVIWADVSASDTISFDCLQGFLRANRELAFGIRCREVAQTEEGKRKITDVTAKYRFTGEVSKLLVMKEENKREELLDLCQSSPKNKLCTVHIQH